MINFIYRKYGSYDELDIFLILLSEFVCIHSGELQVVTLLNKTVHVDRYIAQFYQFLAQQIFLQFRLSHFFLKTNNTSGQVGFVINVTSDQEIADQCPGMSNFTLNL